MNLLALVPNRDPDPPNDLAADVPVAQILHPAKEVVFKALAHERYLATLHSLNRQIAKRLFKETLGSFGHRHKPLRPYLWLNRRVALIASWHGVLVALFYFCEQTFGFQF